MPALNCHSDAPPRDLIQDHRASKINHHVQICGAVYRGSWPSAHVLHAVQAQPAHTRMNAQAPQPNGPFDPVYDGLACIASTELRLRVSHAEGCYRLQTDTADYRVSANTIHARQRATEIHEETLLYGPVLLLNLVLNRVYAMHASAITTGARVVLFLGPSGVGKSTLARALDAAGTATRLADDIVPWCVSDRGLQVFSDFPQLKLETPIRQSVPSDSPVDLVFMREANQFAVRAVDTHLGVRALLGHSVASRLYAANDLRRHLAACGALVQKSRLFALDYPRNAGAIERISGWLDVA